MYTEPRSYLCRAAAETDPTSIDFLQLHKNESKFRYTFLEEIDLINQEAWNNLSETFAEALMERLD